MRTALTAECVRRWAVRSIAGGHSVVRLHGGGDRRVSHPLGPPRRAPGIPPVVQARGQPGDVSMLRLTCAPVWWSSNLLQHLLCGLMHHVANGATSFVGDTQLLPRNGDEPPVGADAPFALESAERDGDRLP